MKIHSSFQGEWNICPTEREFQLSRVPVIQGPIDPGSQLSRAHAFFYKEPSQGLVLELPYLDLFLSNSSNKNSLLSMWKMETAVFL